MTHCACPDCFEIAVGDDPVMCLDCEEAGCDGEGECQAPGAYGVAEPEPGDYILSPCGRLGSRVVLGIVGEHHVAEYHDEDEALAWLRARMNREKFYPNVWRQDDHGGLLLLNVTTCQEALS